MMDRGHQLTEERLSQLEKRIAKEYRQATAETRKKLEDYLRETEEKRKIQEQLYKAGKITKKEYGDWCYRHMMIGARWENMRDTLADDFHNANKIALKLAKGEMPNIYALNGNYATYRIEHDGKIDTSFTLYNHDTAEDLLMHERELMPGPSTRKQKQIAANKDMQWNKQRIQSAVLQGVLQGESPYDVAKRLMNVGQMNYNSAVRYARTMTTNAQNSGRYQAFRRAKGLGVDLTIEWEATLDNRTRHEHRMMHGQRRNVDEPFEIDGVKIMWPGNDKCGSSTVPQEYIWNCRCTLLSWVKGFEGDTVKKSPKMGDMTFEEWLDTKPIPDTQADRKQFAEYQKLLGRDAPKYFTEFQDIKYNNQDQWKTLKREAHMERVIRDAPCELTKRKFSEFFLKPGAKHANDFFDVGYTTEDVRLLRYDIARQFDISKAVSRTNNGYGAENFDIIMQLGKEKKGRFITGWQIDNVGDLPRIITGYRREL